MKKSEEFYQRVQAGEEKTTAQWAVELYGEDTYAYRSNISRFMRALRKRDVMIFPVKRSEGRVGGIVEIVNRKPTEFTATVNRMQRNHVEPMMRSGFHYMEILVDEHPELKELAVGLAKHILTIAYEKERHILGIAYVPSGVSPEQAAQRQLPAA